MQNRAQLLDSETKNGKHEQSLPALPDLTQLPSADYAGRRKRFFAQLRANAETAHAVVILPSAPVYKRNSDVEHDYRQESDLFYLTGLDEPESCAVLDAAKESMVLFVRPRDKAREVWDGLRIGVEGALALGAEKTFPIGELAKELPALLLGHDTVVYRFRRSQEMDHLLLGAIDGCKGKARTGAAYPVRMLDPGPLLHELRLCKQEDELAQMRAAAQISARAHVLCMQETKPGMFEYELEGRLMEVFRRAGSERVAYGSIVGSGPNATILHHRKNDRQMQSGELLLIDAGCELGLFASDITRTFPVGPRFSEAQRAVYEVVLAAQEAVVAAVKPGISIDELHTMTVLHLVRGMVNIGLLQGDVAELIEKETYKRYYMHRTSHFLGMDVHDVGAYYVGAPDARVCRPLGEGMVLTVEPGIYVAADDSEAPEKYRGIGIRIEDDILVTKGGYENLTAMCPKSVAAIEALRARAFA
jgi:Xaa-Pro aminopeptidase